MAQTYRFAYCSPDASKILGSGDFNGFEEQAANEVEFHGQSGTTVHQSATIQTSLREEPVRRFNPIHKDVFPGNQDLVENDDGVVFIHPAGKRIVERAARRRGDIFIGSATNNF